MNGFDLKAALLAKHAQPPVVIHLPIALFIISVVFDYARGLEKQSNDVEGRIL
jgi:uncharacterized membrane protein